MDNTEELGISFCSGYGGLDRGPELAGVKTRTVAYVEIEAFAIANLVAKMETGLLVPAPVWTNLKTFNAEAFRGVDFITAGYPCQPFSCAGQRKGTEDQRHLWPHLRRIYQTIQPRWMFFENVEGHVTLGLSTVISDLEEDGYRTTWGLFTAAEVGAPHRRKRVFILAESKSRVSGQSTERKRRQGSGGGSKESVDDTRCERKTVGCLQASWIEQSGEVLGNASSVRPCGVRENAGTVSQNEDGEERRMCESSGASTLPGYESQEGMADTNQPGPQGRNGGIVPERAVKWPARPGSPQYDWEEPRVTQPGMGRAVDGISSRVDRLRLLGNGVVPQQAARAYTILKERLTNQPEVTNG